MEVFERNVPLALVIPVRNQTELLHQCLSGVAKQTFSLEDYEVLICDDGSTEDIRSVVEKFRGIFNFSSHIDASTMHSGTYEFSIMPYVIIKR